MSAALFTARTAHAAALAQSAQDLLGAVKRNLRTPSSLQSHRSVFKALRYFLQVLKTCLVPVLLCQVLGRRPYFIRLGSR